MRGLGLKLAAVIGVLLVVLAFRWVVRSGGVGPAGSPVERTEPDARRAAVPLQLDAQPEATVGEAPDGVDGASVGRESVAEIAEATDARAEEQPGPQVLEIVDPRGVPLVGLPVVMRFSEPQSNRRPDAQVTADARGRVELEAPPAREQGGSSTSRDAGPWVSVAPVWFGDRPREVVLRRHGPEFAGGVARVVLDVGVWDVELEGGGGERAAVAWEAPLEWLPSPRADLAGAAGPADIAESVFSWHWVEAGQRLWVNPALGGAPGHAFDPPGAAPLRFPPVGTVDLPGILRVPTAQPELRLSGWLEPFEEGDELLELRVGSVESGFSPRAVEVGADGRFEWDRSSGSQPEPWGAPDLVSLAAVVQRAGDGPPRMAWRTFAPALQGRGAHGLGVLHVEPLPLLVAGRIEEELVLPSDALQESGDLRDSVALALLLGRSEEWPERRAQVVSAEFIEAVREQGGSGSRSRFAGNWNVGPVVWSKPRADEERSAPPHVQVSTQIDEDGAFTVWGTWPEPTGWLRIGGCEPVEFRVGDEDVIVPVAR